MRTIEKMVSDEVYVCVDSMVNFILENGHLENSLFTHDDIENQYNAETDEYQEVLSWYFVSDWLLNRLREKGEVVIDDDYHKLWGRGTFGQAIEADSVIQEIYADCINSYESEFPKTQEFLELMKRF